jgi:hypothetical protein
MAMKHDEFIHWYLTFVYLPGLICIGKYIDSASKNEYQGFLLG